MAQVALHNSSRIVWEGTDKKGKKIKGKMLAAIRSGRKGRPSPSGRAREESAQGIATLQERQESQPQKTSRCSLASSQRCCRPAFRWFRRSTSSATVMTSRDAETDPRDQSRTSKRERLCTKSLAKHPLYFDDLFVNLVQAGEQAGALETLLDKVATYKEKTEALKKKIKKALFYPTAVLVVAVIVTIILLIFVIPQFESLFKGFGADLPAFTQMVINMSRFVQEKGWLLAHDLRWCRLRLLLLQEALAPDAASAGSHAAQGTDRWTYHGEGRYCALRENAFDHVRRGCSAG